MVQEDIPGQIRALRFCILLIPVISPPPALAWTYLTSISSDEPIWSYFRGHYLLHQAPTNHAALQLQSRMVMARWISRAPVIEQRSNSLRVVVLMRPTSVRDRQYLYEESALGLGK